MKNLHVYKTAIRTAALLIFFLSTSSFADKKTPQKGCFGQPDLILNNGKFITVDDEGTLAKAIRISNDRIIAVSEKGLKGVSSRKDRCVEVIDLGGRTVIPGLIDSHTHIFRNGNVPGYYLRDIETTSSVSQVQQRIEEVATSIDQNKWITTIGGFDPRQLAEKRFPTLTEIDKASKFNPVLIMQAFQGPAVTNSLGKAFFESKGVKVDNSGLLKGSQLMKGLATLYRAHPKSEFVRATADFFEHANSDGLTMAVDQADAGWFGIPLKPEEVPNKNSAVRLWNQGKLTLRLRLSTWFPGLPPKDGKPYPVETYMDNNILGLGDSMLKVSGVGEYVTGSPFSVMGAEKITPAFMKVAKAGWPLAQHSGKKSEHEDHLKAFETVNETYPLEDLRWTIEHAFQITEEQLERFKAMGVGVRVQNQEYMVPKNRRVLPEKEIGPPFRRILDSGIKVGAGTDSTGVSPISPWLNFYFMTTGKDLEGKQRLPAEQTISRMEALRIYTKDNAWFTFDEQDLGSIEVGKLADLAVLSADFLEVSDEELKRIKSELTLVGGKIVWQSEAFRQ